MASIQPTINVGDRRTRRPQSLEAMPGSLPLTFPVLVQMSRRVAGKVHAATEDLIVLSTRYTYTRCINMMLRGQRMRFLGLTMQLKMHEMNSLLEEMEVAWLEIQDQRAVLANRIKTGPVRGIRTLLNKYDGIVRQFIKNSDALCNMWTDLEGYLDERDRLNYASTL
ncbi:hypothetical protein FALBO_2601 [Fusarium albosuccineum]|uniref:Uncharacterized protein n=1 Tax=Fusarium albosuccineum TaxID=1237068 RepID=A0A8H4LMF4_9HYPO|nr:hypothetical protein FALBO_2601 [Fusarium albosuccineum]